MKHQYELRHFRYFQAVATELNFHRAAEQLYITQPGLTRQIKQLEDLLSTQLFERTKRSVSLTPAGEYLFQELEPLFSKIENMVEQTHQIGQGIRGFLRIGFVGSAMQEIIPNILVELHNHFPDIHTKLAEIPNTDQIHQLSHQLLDIAFVRMKSFPQGIQYHTVLRDTFSLVLPEDHWLTIDNFKSLYQLREESFILFDPDYSPDYYSQIMSLFEMAGFKPKVDHKSVHASTIFRLIEHGLGVAIIPTTLLKGFDLAVKSVVITEVSNHAELVMAWNASSRNPALQHFLSIARTLNK